MGIVRELAVRLADYENPKSLGIDDLKDGITRCVNNAVWQNTDAVRLEVIVDGKKEMKITLVDFLKDMKEVE